MVIEGKLFDVHDVHLRVVDSLKMVAETPGGTLVLWELPDPDAPVPPASEAAVRRQRIYDLLVAAVDSSTNWEAEKAAVQKVVDEHDELERVVPYDHAHAYEIFWRNGPLGGIIWTPERTLGTGTGAATRETINRALERDIADLCSAMDEGALLVLWSRGTKEPGVQIFRGPAISKVLREIAFLKTVQDSVSLLSPEAIESITRQPKGDR